MADPRGFLKNRERVERPTRPVPVRIMDFKDVYVRQDEAIVRTQAGRCMDCGIPFCHSGCPLGNLIPEWNDLVRRGRWDEAAARLHSTNNFPEVTGRICPAPCEDSCTLGINQPAVTIKQTEVAIAEQIFDNDWLEPVVPARLNGHTVAVVGSGPAGLAAAQPGGLLVELKTLLLGDRQHALDRGWTDPSLRGLAVEHVAGGGYRNVGEAGDVGQFQLGA